MKTAIGLGCSLGDRRQTLSRTLRHLDAHPGLRLLKSSKWYRNPPMKGGTARGWFLNGVALFDSELDPFDLLDFCRSLEMAAGRRRARYWGDRPLDLDVLMVEGWRSEDPRLVVPHPGILHRPFVWVPLREVWPTAYPQWPTHPLGLSAQGIDSNSPLRTYIANHKRQR